MAQAGTVVYTLELQGGKFYVGKTNDLQSRLDEHRRGGSRASAWTRKYPFVRLVAAVPCRDDFDELRVTLNLMRTHGMHNVRGASYVDVNLSQEQKDDISIHLATASDSCFRCGARDHFAARCEFHGEQRGPFLSNNRVNESLRCQRCGRTSHSANACFAGTDVSGHPISNPVFGRPSGPTPRRGCARCGRSSHNAVDCFATTDINGNVMSDMMYDDGYDDDDDDDDDDSDDDSDDLWDDY